MSKAKRWIARMGYDVRVRNRDFASILKGHLSHGDIFLDAGCGDLLISDYFDCGQFVGLDLSNKHPNRGVGEYVAGSIFQLPFEDQAFSFTGSLDVLEHLSHEERRLAIEELVRTARVGVVVGFPFAGKPEALDREFYERLIAASRPIPEWLHEHLSQSYPEVTEIGSLIQEAFLLTGAAGEISLTYSENLTVTKRLRTLAAISGRAYLLANIFLGLSSSIHSGSRRPSNSYRAIIVARKVSVR